MEKEMDVLSVKDSRKFEVHCRAGGWAGEIHGAVEGIAESGLTERFIEQKPLDGAEYFATLRMTEWRGGSKSGDAERQRRVALGRLEGEVLRLAALAQDDYPLRIASLKVER